MAAGYYDANGVYQYGESDPIALYSDFMNLGQASVSSQFTNDRARIATLENTVSGGNTPNVVHNSNFTVWQRGTSTQVISNIGYTADRWNAWCLVAGGSMDVSRQNTGLTGFRYCARFQRTAGNSSNTTLVFAQPMETAASIPLAGKTFTMSFYARAGANYSMSGSVLGVTMSTGTGTDQVLYNFWGNYALATSVTLTTSWQRFTVTGTIPSGSTQLAPGFYMVPSGTAGAADYYEVTGVQVEVGNYATPYKPNQPSEAGELANCQRFYVRWSHSTAAVIASGVGLSGTGAAYILQLPTTMRAAPTAVTIGSTLTSYSFTGTNGTVSSASMSYTGDPKTVRIDTSGSSYTTNMAYSLVTGTNGYLAITAEL